MEPQRFGTRLIYWASLFIALLLSGCAGPVYTTDDGSPVDEKLLASIRLYGKAEQALHPPIVKAAELKDFSCDTQWELPFVVATSYDLPRQEKIAWARGLQVDERLTIIAAAPNLGLKAGDKIIEIDGDDDDPLDLYEELMEFRDEGDEFPITLSDGRKFEITPVKVCRGLVQVTKPVDPNAQNYHWLSTTHPMSLFGHDLTPDEAMWVVLWTQGLSEEAGARMKTYHYGMKFARTAITVASIASGVGAAAQAASTAAANIAATEASKAAAQAAGKEIASHVAQQMADSVREAMIEATIKGVAKEAAKAAAQEMASAAIANAGLFKSTLSGISWMAGTGFYMADKWALDRMPVLGADPMAAFTLHHKLATKGQADNAFVFDEDRLKDILTHAEAKGFGAPALLALAGVYGDSAMVADSPLTEDAPAGEVEIGDVGASGHHEIVTIGSTSDSAAFADDTQADTVMAEAPQSAEKRADNTDPLQLTAND